MGGGGGGMTLAEFSSFVTTALTAGSSREDILGAFKTIATSMGQGREGGKEGGQGGGGGGGRGGVISGEVLNLVFEAQGDCVAYMKEHMPETGVEKLKKRKQGKERGGEEADGEEGEEEEVEVPVYDYMSFVSYIFER